MSNTRSMATAVALIASSALVGVGCATSAADPGEDGDSQAIVADDGVQASDPGQALHEESANVAASDSKDGATGESKDALWGWGFPGFGWGGGWGGWGYPGFGWGGFGRPWGWGVGWGYPGFGWGGWW